MATDIMGLLTGVSKQGIDPMLSQLTPAQQRMEFGRQSAQGLQRAVGGMFGGQPTIQQQLAQAVGQKQRADEAKEQQQQESIIAFAEKRYVDNPEYVDLIKVGVPLKDVESMFKGEKDFVVVGNSIYIPSTGEFKAMPKTGSDEKPIIKEVFSEEKNANVLRFYDPNDPNRLLYEELAPKDQARSSVALLKLINETNAKAQEQRVRVQKVGALADKLDEAQGKIASGLASTAKEAFKEVFGTQDYESELRTEAQRLRTSNAVKNLPTGPASDKDIRLVLSGEPPANASPAYLAEYARGIQKLAQYEADYYTASASWLDRYGDNRGFNSYLQREQAEETLAAVPQEAIARLEAVNFDPMALAIFEQKYGFSYTDMMAKKERADKNLKALNREDF